MYVVHGTKKLRDRVPPTASGLEPATTALGDWYATVLLWRPQVALFVNEPTLLPVLLLFAPAATVLDRFRAAAAEVLAAHRVSSDFIANEVDEMVQCRLTKTDNRSVLGVMNEFAYLADAYRSSTPDLDLQKLSLRLAETPCSPLYRSHTSPDRALAAIIG